VKQTRLMELAEAEERKIAKAESQSERLQHPCQSQATSSE
jgi:hypothetical protein